MPILRIARPTNDLAEIRRFYEKGLGLEVIGHFQDHDGFDGVMLGRKGQPYHFEFTVRRGHHAPKAPSEDHLVVFYIPAEQEYKEAVNRMLDHGFSAVKSLNPYWDKSGTTFQDLEGYRVVLYRGAWAG